jgi:hypothetical protein
MDKDSDVGVLVIKVESRMRLATLEVILRALQASGARYIVVGGVAVNAHGYQRLTQDLDVCFSMDGDNLRDALDALARLGYRPMLPVKMLEFADATKREDWIANRNLQVFSLVSDAHQDATIDILASLPFNFDDEYGRALFAELAPGLRVPSASIETLIAMKEKTGRARDQDDVDHLRMILDETGRHE